MTYKLITLGALAASTLLLSTAAKAAQPVQLTAQQYFTVADLDRSGRLTLKEYVDYSVQQRGIQPELAAQEFTAMDIDKDGKLSLSELEGTQSLRMAMY